MARVSNAPLSCLPCGAASRFPARTSSHTIKLPPTRSTNSILTIDASSSSSSHVPASHTADSHPPPLVEQLSPPGTQRLQSLPQEAPPARRKPLFIDRHSLKKHHRGLPAQRSDTVIEALRRLQDADQSYDAIASAFSTWNSSLSCKDVVMILNEERNSQKALAFFQWLKTNEAFSPNVFVYNVLLKVLRREGKWSAALELMEEMEEKGIVPDNITYSTIISFATRCKLPEEAFKWYELMQAAGCTPDRVTYSTMVNVYGEAGRMKEAFDIYADMRRQGLGLDNATCSTMMKLHAMQGNIGAAMDVFEELKLENVIPNAVTFNCIIGILLKAGRTQQIFKLFEEMQTRGVKPSEVTFSLLIRAYARAGKTEDAFKLLSMVKEAGVEVDTVGYNSLLSLCAETGFVEEGENILKELLQSEKYQPDSWTWSIMVEMYAKAGRIDEARKAFQNISNSGLYPDIAGYTSLIRGYSILRDFKGVATVFDELVTAGLPFDEILVGTLLQILSACEGQEDTAVIMPCIEKARPRLRKVIEMLLNENFVFESWKEEFNSFINETPSDSHKVFSNLLINLCWAKNLGERSHQIMSWAISFGLYPELQSKNFVEWTLNLRPLSIGAARTALQAWFRSLSNTLDQGKELPSVLVIDAGTSVSRASVSALNAFVVSQLEEMHAPFEESSYRGGQYTATGESVKLWLQSGNCALQNTCP